MQTNVLRAPHGRVQARAPCARPQRRVAVVSHATGNGTAASALGLDEPIELVDGRVTSGPDLSVEVNGMKLPNPFIIGSGPPGTNYQVMKKAFDEGWGGVICKASPTLSLDSSKVVNVTPRYAKIRDYSNRVFGWQNFELISDRPFDVMLAEMKRLREEYPNRMLIASIMEEYNKDAWEEIIGRCEEIKVDAFEINFSCPHGLPERRMGMAMGQDPEVLGEVCGWINKAATVPVWAKMTPNVTDISFPADVALKAGCEGVAAINTIQCISATHYIGAGHDMRMLGGGPPVHHPPGIGWLRAATAPGLAAASDVHLSRRSLSGIGGVETGGDAAEFILLGSDTVQVCTGVMIHGYPVVKNLCGGLQKFMQKHDFKSIAEFKGKSLPYVTVHSELVKRQRDAISAKKARQGLANDAEWSGEDFVKNADSMAVNR
eukprot:XP_001693794.1 psbA translation factor [Chlamydomonas reinhardtii]